MAASSFIVITLFALALVASIAEARVAPGEHTTLQGVAKDEPLAEAIEHLIHGESTSLPSKKINCHSSNDNENAFVRDFEPRPNLSAYPDDAKLKGERTFTKDFEPRPNISDFPDEDAGLKAEKEFVKDFEPRPNVSVHQG